MACLPFPAMKVNGRGTAKGTGTLLGVWAHPDDEAYLSAGLMATARAAGHRVVVATATLGERGTPDPDRWPPARLGPVREEEMTRSLAAVDVHDHRWLHHADGTLAQVPIERGATQIGELIFEVCPDTIVTFGPDGMTGHPDHRAVSRWVTRAWLASGRRARLWYATLTPDFHRRWDAVNRDVGLWYPGTRPPCHPVDDLACSVTCTGEMLNRKMAALRAHDSQTGPLIDRVGADPYRQWWAGEYFVEALTVRLDADAA